MTPKTPRLVSRRCPPAVEGDPSTLTNAVEPVFSQSHRLEADLPTRLENLHFDVFLEKAEEV